MMQDQPTVKTQPLKDGVYVQLSGEIDLSHSGEVRHGLLQLTKGGPARMVIDLSDVPYMDSSGVATLVEALQQQRRNRAKMVLCGLQPRVRSIFEIARLDKVFSIVDDVETAKTT